MLSGLSSLWATSIRTDLLLSRFCLLCGQRLPSGWRPHKDPHAPERGPHARQTEIHPDHRLREVIPEPEARSLCSA